MLITKSLKIIGLLGSLAASSLTVYTGDFWNDQIKSEQAENAKHRASHLELELRCIYRAQSGQSDQSCAETFGKGVNRDFSHDTSSEAETSRYADDPDRKLLLKIAAWVVPLGILLTFLSEFAEFVMGEVKRSGKTSPSALESPASSGAQLGGSVAAPSDNAPQDNAAPEINPGDVPSPPPR